MKGDETKTNSNPIFDSIVTNSIVWKNKSGYYAGIGGGASFLYGMNDPIPVIDLKFGVYSFFNPYIGVRGYASFDYGYSRWHSRSMAFMLSLGLDVIIEAPISKKHYVYAGFIGAFGLQGYLVYNQVAHKTFSDLEKSGAIIAQVGLTTSISKQSRISAIYRFFPNRKITQFKPTGFVILEYSFKF